jgi:hypothetical protein
MVGVDDVVAELELDALDLADGVELVDQLLFDCLWNGVLLRYGPGVAFTRSAGSGPRG